MIKQNGIIHFPKQNDVLPIIGRSALDCSVFIRITNGSLNDIKLGSLEFYGDDAVQKKVRSRISNPNFFEDLMVEFYTAAWYMNEKYSITPLEVENFPDFQVRLDTNNFFVECKHLTTKSKNRINEVIKDANSQIRKTGNSSVGVLVLDVSRIVGFNRVPDDSLSSELKGILDNVQSALRGEKNRAIIGAAAVWDDYMQLGEPPNKTHIAVRRRQAIVMHDTQPSRYAVRFFQGQSVVFGVNWSN